MKTTILGVAFILGLSLTSHAALAPSPAVKHAKQISTSLTHSCAAYLDGTVNCWGSNTNGELGTGDYTSSAVPIQVEGITNAKQVLAGDTYSCALLVDGVVKCWGSIVPKGENITYVYGPNFFSKAPPPNALSPIKIADHAIALTGTFSPLVLQSNGVVKRFGGEMEEGIPVFQIYTASGWSVTQNMASLDGTGLIPCGITDAHYYACIVGNNYIAKSKKFDDVAMAVAEYKGLASANVLNVCMLHTDGVVNCATNRMGYYYDDNISNPPGKENGPYKTIDINLKDVASLAANYNQTCAVMKDGSVNCWSVTDHTDPTPVPALTNVAQLSLGDKSSCAVLKDGDIRCW